MKYTGPKAKRCRRQGTNLYGSDKYDKILQRKPQLPGKGPRDRAGRRSEYAQQLIEKQKMRDIYGLSERQFRGIYDRAAKTGGQTGEVMQQLLERRLDNALYRAGFAMTRMQARQFASHGLFFIDGVRVTSPSYLLKAGQKITPRPRSKTSPAFASIAAAHDKYLPPAWMKVNSAGMEIEILSLPEPDKTEQVVDIRQVIEFYSRN
ncbi:MAG: 30S ribosomal protein S4 [Candidatus Peribacteraceae bacterium]|nr:30S ribosomal protein S4 [Candidatus Peribacteraceae bacterium]